MFLLKLYYIIFSNISQVTLSEYELQHTERLPD